MSLTIKKSKYLSFLFLSVFHSCTALHPWCEQSIRYFKLWCRHWWIKSKCMCCDCFSDYVLQIVDNRNLTSSLDAIVLFVCLKVRYPIPFLYDFFYKLFQRWLGSYIFTPTRALKVNLYFIKNLQMPRLTTQLCIIFFSLASNEIVLI